MKLKRFKVEVFSIFGKLINSYDVIARNKTSARRAVIFYTKNPLKGDSFKVTEL